MDDRLQGPGIAETLEARDICIGQRAESYSMRETG